MHIRVYAASRYREGLACERLRAHDRANPTAAVAEAAKHYGVAPAEIVTDTTPRDQWPTIAWRQP